MQKTIKFYESSPSSMRHDHRVAWDSACLPWPISSIACRYVLLLPRLESLPAIPDGRHVYDGTSFKPGLEYHPPGEAPPMTRMSFRAVDMRVALAPYSRPNLTKMETPEP